MVKGSWIISINAMRCKNWINGIEVVFHLDEQGQPVGRIIPLPEGLYDKLPRGQDRMIYVCRMWQRACVIFYKAYYRYLFKKHYAEKGQV
jgi:hypothetical protein